MASVHRNKKSPYWYCAYTDAGGQRVFRSTKQKKKSDAWEVALALEHVARDAVRGKITEAHISKIISSTVEKVHPGTSVVTTTREWVQAWVDDKSASKAGKTGERYSGIANGFLKSLGKKADQPLSYLTKLDVQKFRDSQLKAGLSNSAVDLGVKAIRSFLKLAVGQELLSTNPALAVELLGRDKSLKRAFTDDEVVKLIDAAPTADWKGLTLVGYYVGGRLSNCARLRWEQVDFKSGLIIYEPVKQKKKSSPKTLTVPIHDDLLRCLQPRRQMSGFCFPTLALMPVEGESGLSRTFRKLIDSAGIKYSAKKPRGSGGRQSFELGFHSLRRSFNSRLANLGVRQEVRQLLVGHASEEVNDGYTEIELKTFRDAIDKLPSLLKPDSPSASTPLR